MNECFKIDEKINGKWKVYNLDVNAFLRNPVNVEYQPENKYFLATIHICGLEFKIEDFYLTDNGNRLENQAGWYLIRV